MRRRRVPDVVVRRLALYLRVLEEMGPGDPDRFISSQELGDRAGMSAAQVRKDLALFGEFGKQGVGYQARFLRDELRRILNIHRPVNVGIVGVGELGTALARYNLRRWAASDNYPFRLVALYDDDPAKIGTRVDALEITCASAIPTHARELKVKIMMIAVPSAAAQAVADLCIAGGVRAILNFAPCKLQIPPQVHLHQSDVSLELEQLAFYL